MTKKLLRLDSAPLKFEVTEEGYLKGEAVVSRIGVFHYRDADGNLRRELRHPFDVFSSDSMESLKMIPVTNGHPPQIIDSNNAKIYSIGHVGETIRVDGVNLVASFVITDSKAIEDIKNGRRELSLGYLQEPVMVKGVYDGEEYDYRQTEIRYNHLSVVDEARAGRDAVINLDGNGSVDLLNINFSPKKESSSMATINIDGINYEAPQEVSNHVSKLVKAVEESQSTLANKDGEIADVKKTSSALEAERDDLKEKLEVELKKDHTGEVEKAVEERLAVLNIVQRVDSKFEPAGKTVQQIKKEILSNRTKTNLDEKDEVYIDARWDAMVETLSSDNFRDQREKAGSDFTGDSKDPDDSRAKMKENRRLKK